jgi:hypothetical protein
MVKDFDALVKEKAGGCTCLDLVLMDGHSSYYTPELLKYAWDNNIVILAYATRFGHCLFHKDEGVLEGNM